MASVRFTTSSARRIGWTCAFTVAGDTKTFGEC